MQAALAAYARTKTAWAVRQAGRQPEAAAGKRKPPDRGKSTKTGATTPENDYFRPEDAGAWHPNRILAHSANQQ